MEDRIDLVEALWAGVIDGRQNATKIGVILRKNIRAQPNSKQAGSGVLHALLQAVVVKQKGFTEV